MNLITQGHSRRAFIVVEIMIVIVATATFTALPDIAPADLWSPYYP